MTHRCIESLTMAFVAETVPKDKTGSAMGLLGTMSAVGTALGPSLGGVLIATQGWQALFYINLPLGLLAFVLAHRFLPFDKQMPPTSAAGFDQVGTLLLAGTLAAYALAMTIRFGSGGNGEQAGFGLFNFALLAAAGVGAGLFVLAQARVASPLIRLEAFHNPVLSSSLATNLLVATVMMATLVVGPFYLSRALGLNAVQVGLVLSIGPVLSAFSGFLAGRLVDRWGAQHTVLAGLVAAAVGAIALSVLPGVLGIAGYIAAIAVLTPGYQLFQAANNTAVMADVQPAQRGVVSGMLNLSRNLGLITGASAMGAVFAWASNASDIATAPPESVASGMRITFGAAAALVALAIAIALRGQRVVVRRHLA